MTPAAKKALIAAAIILTVAAIVVLYCFDPMQASFYPRCPSKLLTGCDCPGCGTLRALHALSHGDISAAWHFNAALFFALPSAVVFFIGDRPRAPRWASAAAHWRYSPVILLAAIVLWTIFRNL